MGKELARNTENSSVEMMRRQLASPGFKDRLMKLHRDVPVDRYLMTVNILINQTPKLQSCTPASILMAVTEAFRHRLSLGGSMPEAYLVPYGTEARFMLGYRGMISLAVRHGVAKKLWAHTVDALDDLDVQLGDAPKLIHRPNFMTDRLEENIVAAYAVAMLPDDSTQFTVMSRGEIDKVRGVSQTGRSASSPWSQWFDQMAAKSAIRRLFKQLPAPSEDFRRVMDDDAAIDTGERPSYLQGAEEPLEIGATVSAQLAETLSDGGTEPETEQADAEPPKKGRRQSRKADADPSDGAAQEEQDGGPIRMSMVEQCEIAYAETAESKGCPVPKNIPVSRLVAKLAARLEVTPWPTDDKDGIRKVFDAIPKANFALIESAVRDEFVKE